MTSKNYKLFHWVLIVITLHVQYDVGVGAGVVGAEAEHVSLYMAPPK
jgi:hypothetical protein